MPDSELLLIDDPRPGVRRRTFNRPEKRDEKFGDHRTAKRDPKRKGDVGK